MVRIITFQEREHLSNLKEKSNANLKEAAKIVSQITEDVRKRGDTALREYTEKFDKVHLKDLKVSKEEIKDAYNQVDKKIIAAINVAKKNISKYHELQMPKGWMKKISDGVEAGQIVRPLDSVGCYVPGGKYPLVSTVLMTVLPAKIAGVRNIIICTPPSKSAPKNGKLNVNQINKKTGTINPAILVAADICGATSIYKVGGSQSIAAMAYGTETIPKVNKIVGPGNIYVTAAKKLVYGDCGIDFIAGPSEIMIVADEKSNPKFIAADMLSQAEHDELASSILVTTSKKIADEVNYELDTQLKSLSTRETAKNSLDDYGLIIVVKNIDEASIIVNEFAPEHLELMINECENLLKKINNAGAIFLGPYSVEAAGDYCSGPNHVLPTAGSAKFRAGLSIFDFIKMPTVQKLTMQGLKNLAPSIETLSELEGLIAHKKSVEIRLK